MGLFITNCDLGAAWPTELRKFWFRSD